MPVYASHVKQKRWPDWGLNPGPSRHIPDALTTELSGLFTSKSTNLLIMPLPSEQHQNTTSEYTPCKTDTCRGMIKHMHGCLGKAFPDRSLFNMSDYIIQHRVPMLADGKTPATEDQIESKESKIIEFKKREYLARHIILSTTSMCLETKIKGLPTTKAMWKEVKEDAMSKSTLCLLDAEDQLASMKLADNDNPKTHLEELKQHFQTMLQCRDCF